MTSAKTFLLEIDGAPTDYDGPYDDVEFGPAGALFGLNETTGPKDTVRSFLPTKAVYCLAVWGRKPDGGIWGIQGLYSRGEWAVARDGTAIYRVWERIV